MGCLLVIKNKRDAMALNSRISLHCELPSGFGREENRGYSFFRADEIATPGGYLSGIVTATLLEFPKPQKVTVILY